MRLSENTTTKTIVIGGAALGIIGTIYLVASEVNTIFNPDATVPKEQEGRPLLHKPKDTAKSATQILEDALNGK